MTDELPWLSLTEAAEQSGLHREAVRARARRGLIPSRKGNSGETLVQIVGGQGMAEAGHDIADPGQGKAGEMARLTEGLADL